MTDVNNTNYSLPSRALAAAQTVWLRGARARLLRHVNVARRRHVVELGAGWGHVSAELEQRRQGRVIAVDMDAKALRCCAAMDHVQRRIQRVQADAHNLPFGDSTCDLVVTQCAFLWFSRAERVIAEIYRVLADDGAVALIEPDFGGMMEYPAEVSVREIWLAVLTRCGADPFVGRKLLSLLAQHGFETECFLLDRIPPPSNERFDFLLELPLTDEERKIVDRAKALTPSGQVAHLPFFLIAGRVKS